MSARQALGSEQAAQKIHASLLAGRQPLPWSSSVVKKKPIRNVFVVLLPARAAATRRCRGAARHALGGAFGRRACDLTAAPTTHAASCPARDACLRLAHRLRCRHWQHLRLRRGQWRRHATTGMHLLRARSLKREPAAAKDVQRVAVVAVGAFAIRARRLLQDHLLCAVRRAIVAAHVAVRCPRRRRHARADRIATPSAVHLSTAFVSGAVAVAAAVPAAGVGGIVDARTVNVGGVAVVAAAVGRLSRMRRRGVADDGICVGVCERCHVANTAAVRARFCATVRGGCGGAEVGSALGMANNGVACGDRLAHTIHPAVPHTGVA
mmetsp:Transcript_44893/g.134054  ORF Transcript_44893/g.134054 Transcript_44893/m.134054 type:complete len:323 (+) Transcript_44893:586-1554(+)